MKSILSALIFVCLAQFSVCLVLPIVENFERPAVLSNKNSIERFDNKPDELFGKSIKSYFHDLVRLMTKNNEPFSDSFLCSTCKFVLGLVDSLVTSNMTFEDVRPYAVQICSKLLTSEGMNGDFLCPNIIKAYGPPYWFVMTSIVLQPEQVCEDFRICPHHPNRAHKKLSDYVTQTESLKVDNYPRWKAADDKTQRSQERIKIAMISDAHVEHKYAKGTPTQCGLFGCCYKGFSGTGSAGEWGDYNCDIPEKTLEFILDHIKNMPGKPDFMIYGGDTPSHHIWEQSLTLQLSNDKVFNDYLIKTFKGWTIYPVIGNHESYPNSVYYQKGPMYQYLNKKLAEWWRPLFNLTSEQVDTIKYAGYYTALIRPGLRILALNTDFWLASNPFFLINDQIPAYADQLKFVDSVLQNARKNKEKVIFAGHVPAIDISSVALDYPDLHTDIAAKYSDVIVFQPFGHTHHNHFAVIMDLKTQKPVGVQHVTGSLTTYQHINPSFSIFYLDSSSFELVDYESYYFDIRRANAGKPEIKQQLSAKKDYKMADFSPQSFFDLSERFAKDDKMLTRYVNMYYSQSPDAQKCDKSCRKGLRCGTQGLTTQQHGVCEAKP